MSLLSLLNKYEFFTVVYFFNFFIYKALQLLSGKNLHKSVNRHCILATQRQSIIGSLYVVVLNNWIVIQVKVKFD